MTFRYYLGSELQMEKKALADQSCDAPEILTKHWGKIIQRSIWYIVEKWMELDAPRGRSHQWIWIEQGRIRDDPFSCETNPTGGGSLTVSGSIELTDFGSDVLGAISPILDAIGLLDANGKLDIGGWNLNKAMGIFKTYERTSSILDFYVCLQMSLQFVIVNLSMKMGDCQVL